MVELDYDFDSINFCWKYEGRQRVGGGGLLSIVFTIILVSRQFCKVDIGNFQRFLQHF